MENITASEREQLNDLLWYLWQAAHKDKHIPNMVYSEEQVTVEDLKYPETKS